MTSSKSTSSKPGTRAVATPSQSGTGVDWIYVVDGGYMDDGQKLVDHMRKYYDNPSYIDHVVLTHPDEDHASGLATALNGSTSVACG